MLYMLDASEDDSTLNAWGADEGEVLKVIHWPNYHLKYFKYNKKIFQ